jgi:hypothetical protein
VAFNFAAICNFISVPAIETISFSAEISIHLSDPFISNRVDLAGTQNKDGVLRFWISQVISGQKPRRSSVPKTPEHCVLFQNFDNLQVKDKVLRVKPCQKNLSQMRDVVLSLPWWPI